MTLSVRTTGWLDVSIEVPAGTTVAVVGPNGAGKSTLLRALAGLPTTAAAEVRLDELPLDTLPPHRRRVGWVPQAGLLFPHLDARDNAAYAALAAGQSRRRARADALQWLERLGVGELYDRRPGQLSGGEQQRVALARAFAAAPRILLLDEPLAALDTATRASTRSLLRRHLSSYEGICLLVTHDVVEAVALADRVLVLDGGRVVQDAAPAEVTRAPRSRWVAELFGWNAFVGTTTAHGLRVAAGIELIAAEPLPEGLDAMACIGPGTVAVHRSQPLGSPRNTWAGTVREMVPSGSRLRVMVDGNGSRPDLVAEVTPAAAAELELAEGAPVWVSVKATEVSLAAM